ncbi:MAG: DsbA family protein [Anaerolineae bacterium]|nr:DsbA family protein [Anaerolineae bacterium]
MPKIKSEYVDKGLVRYQFINMPLRSIHPAAQKAAEAALCAGKQGKFWEMHDTLFERQMEWAGQISPLKSFENYARELGLNVDKFNRCLEQGETAPQVQKDLAEAARRGVVAVPTFFINGRKLEGAYPYEVFKSIIEEELRK